MIVDYELQEQIKNTRKLQKYKLFYMISNYPLKYCSISVSEWLGSNQLCST